MSVLRVGVIVDGAACPRWQTRLLGDLRDEPCVELVAVLRAPADVRVRSRGFRAYERLDRRLFAPPGDAGAIEDASALLDALPGFDLTLGPDDAGGRSLAADSLELLRSLQLDLLLQLGGPALNRHVGEVARLGLWVFAHAEAERRGAAPYWNEMTAGARTVESQLIARGASGDTPLYRTWSSTNPNSLVRQRHPVLSKCAAVVGRAARGFATGRVPPFDGGPTAVGDVTPSDGDVAARPGLASVGRFAATAVARVARNRLALRKADRIWFIALRRRRSTPLLDDALDGFEALPCPEDRFHADPILVHDGGAHHLFFEDADRASGIGKLAWCPIDADGRPGDAEIVLETDCHLSYPFVFRWQGAFYMIPETSERRTVELYRAAAFPRRWELVKVLFRDVAAVDTTLFEHAGRFWIFLAMSPTGASLNDELFLFHAETPLGEWIPHPWNPIVSDVRRARPAGPVFRDGGVLWRPGQDCAGDYGAAFWLNRIDRLDPDGYRETPMRRIDPGWMPGGLCTHTYTRAGDFEAMDNRLWKPR